ncbi:MAG: tetratricopeptide repeat protein [Mycobacteriales bacterium]
MIELLLQAERSLSVGQLDAAERLYWQAIENDPQNSIAVVGLARVALDRGDDRTAYQFARKALEIDGENPAARRLVDRLGEVMRYRGETPPTEATPPLRRRSVAESAPKSAPAPSSDPAPASAPPKPKRGLIGRILGRD